jgi:Fur family ferric uptake transcriptional regulator
MTKSRRQVLDILNLSKEPLSASQVFKLTGMSCNQATVYRILSYLEMEGYAESFVLHCENHGTERYFSSLESSHKHWFHCESCHCFIDMGDCTINPFLLAFEKKEHVRMHRHTLYVTGICSSCNIENIHQ